MIGLFNPVAIVVGMITMTALNDLTLTMKYGVLASVAAVAFASQTYGTIYLKEKFSIAQDAVTGMVTLGSLINTVTLAGAI